MLSNFVNRQLFNWSSNLPCRIIAEPGRYYLERYYLFQFRGKMYYLHRFVGSDPDRGHHNHPSRWGLSLILCGWYRELRPTISRIIRWLNYFTCETYHRVLVPAEQDLRDSSLMVERMDQATPEDKRAMIVANGKATGLPHTVWSLFIHPAERVQRWGFRRPTKNGFVHEDYVYQRSGANTDEPGEWWKTVKLGKDEPRRCPHADMV